eukprot:7832134-Pyramimonas_sp.AAC.1
MASSSGSTLMPQDPPHMFSRNCTGIRRTQGLLRIPSASSGLIRTTQDSSGFVQIHQDSSGFSPRAQDSSGPRRNPLDSPSIIQDLARVAQDPEGLLRVPWDIVELFKAPKDS